MITTRQIGIWVSVGAASLLVCALAAKALAPQLVAPQAVITPSAPKTTQAKDRIRFSNADLQQVPLADGTTRVIRSLLQVPNRMAFGDFAWDETGVPAGPIWMRVDLSRQILSVFRGEDEIGTSVILYGQDATPTPTGNFPIRGLETNHRSRNYDAMMPYTLWLTADGVAIHGSNVQQGLATHGCIGVPLAFAQKLFAVAKRGDVVSVVP
ncbi:L,D-transpeptidase family protein [Sphingomonas sp. TDK1]|uniref:L,D-transpeptidase family protein n=1 Tax=Sphingomonas sp. TDK1 TaxID=453247 RepID=UPI0009FD857B|nr:L,D-transpeptidase family protein [Sphingomonas sp. TDK1]